MKKYLFPILTVIVIILLIFYFDQNKEIKQACINEKCFNLYLAQTTIEKQKGLSIFDKISDEEGMLFVYDSERELSFWMKNMKFNIDIIWINSDYEIVHIEKNLSPCLSEENCQIFSPEVNSKYVLEINANLSDEYNFKVGDFVSLES